MNELSFGEIFKLCFKIVSAVLLSLLVIGVPIGLIAGASNTRSRTRLSPCNGTSHGIHDPIC
ncbi:MAG TPA: hypothetical protein VEJ47_21035 [Candidatus Eremiobacteraceae bacterium]|nr:hypothetical protein [Candidatus Eremiobacteraceae bacterium]